MSLTMPQRKKGLYATLTILLGIVMASLAWAQIVSAISRWASLF